MIDEVYYSLEVAPVVWALLGAMVLAVAVVSWLLWRRLVRVCRKVREDDAAAAELASGGDGGAEFPSVSVIVYSQADGHNLRTLLPQILEQDYPAPMEVIVVNDESGDNTETIVSELELRYSNLYMTFAPERSRNLSRRKLSITLGIKAARYDALMLTCGNCRVESPLWLRAMMRHIATGSEVVIGYAAPTGDELCDEDCRKRRRAFDDVWHALRYLSGAIGGHPFMGTGYNLAYARRLFFEHKGFSKTLHLNYGDDDIFVNEIATGDNTAVELSETARVRAIEHSPAELHDSYRLRRDFTARYLPRTPYVSMAAVSVLWWMWLVCGVAASVMSLPSLIGAAVAVVCALVAVVPTMVLWRRASRALDSRGLLWTVPWMIWTRPLRTLRHRWRGRKVRRSQLTHVI